MDKQISLKTVGGILTAIIALFVVMNHWNSFVASPGMVTSVDEKYEDKMKLAMGEVEEVEKQVGEVDTKVDQVDTKINNIQIKQEGFSKDIEYLKKQSEEQKQISQKILEAVQKKE